MDKQPTNLQYRLMYRYQIIMFYTLKSVSASAPKVQYQSGSRKHSESMIVFWQTQKSFKKYTFKNN